MVADLPLFLRECNKFPTTGATNDDDVPRNDGRERRARAFELLVVSFSTLLEIKDAAELLFGVLFNDDDRVNFIWLSDDVYITKQQGRTVQIRQSIYSLEMDKTYNCNIVHICHVQAPATTGTPPDLSPHVLSLLRTQMDVLLRLLAKHKAIEYIDVWGNRLLQIPFRANPSFPASVDALKAFVSEVQSPRVISFGGASLTIDQWRVVTFNCSKDVTLFYRGWVLFAEQLDVLIEAMNQNHCPAKLQIESLDPWMYHNKVPDCLVALGRTISLKHLTVDCTLYFVELCESISRNRGLQHLVLTNARANNFTISESQWQVFCSTVASHPTIKTLELNWRLENGQSRSQERDQLLIQHVSNNSVLWDFHVLQDTGLYNPNLVKETVRPFLEFNRFRAEVEAMNMHNETDDDDDDGTLRKAFFTTTLVQSKKVWKNPMLRFFLLKNNADLLVIRAAARITMLAHHGEKK